MILSNLFNLRSFLTALKIPFFTPFKYCFIHHFMRPLEQHDQIQSALDAYRETVQHHVETAEIPPRVPDYVVVATQYIHEHLYDPELNVASVRDECEIRSNDFSQWFKWIHGTTPHRYIEHHRIAAACRVLTNSGGDLFQIAISIGFSNYQTFLRAFRRVMDQTPTEFQIHTQIQ